MIQQDTASRSLESAGDALALMSDKIERWLAAAVAQLPNVVVAVLVLLGFWLLAGVARNLLGRGFRRTPIAVPIRSLVTNVVTMLIVVVGLFFALGVVGLDKTVTSLLAGVGIVGLALGFAFQDIAANFMSGIILSVRRPLNVGDTVRTNDYLGVVSEITLRTTVLRQFTGEYVRIPNKDVLGSPLLNYSTAGERRVDLTVGVSYGDDLEKVRRVTLATIEGLGSRLASRPVDFYYEGFGASSIDFVVRFWVDFARQPDYLAARSEAVMAVKRTFDAEGITIPFPIRTIDFAPAGGVTFQEAIGPVLQGEHGAGTRARAE